MSQITTHVLDISLGQPAANVPVILESQTVHGEWKAAGRGSTDGDGRAKDLIGASSFIAGTYRLTFDTRSYFAKRKLETLYPQVSIVFDVTDAKQNYHIPLLLSPHGYSTYRGS
jgi:5-hydroxyisourate hydrolase